MTWYTGNATYDTLLLLAFLLVLFTVLGTRFMKTPYGRFADSGLAFNMDPRLGWFLMELPATLTFYWFYFTGDRPLAPVSLVFLAVWTIHYANRGFIFPLLMRVDPGHRKTFSLIVVVAGWVVTSLHGYLNARFITTLGDHFTLSWLTDPRFILGIIVYYSGFFLNLHSDHIIRNLRPKRREEGEERLYRIPQGGAFRWVSNPHYLGELTAWAGFALATWSLAGVFIFAISAANLIPRARLNHNWYRSHFHDYPEQRKALVPMIF
jgi:3-oxo-5-alpha-steroid 4-dehydrogenase 1